jgi:hypothetical protein
MLRCAQAVFQLGGTNRLGALAPPSSKVLDSLDSEGETRRWILQRSCVQMRVAVEDEAGKRDLSSPQAASG